ncbi:hypothetical protein Godav_029314 [Gossypium davidsonii]|uniref:Uncharacterized protein n=1 Tax=Gossypium davidsonii TaxID=34287 RepID=A0A7J8TG75_GOSDV|nr:hypothetical protein [Gossypium davidsonii]
MSSAWKQIHQMKRLVVSPMTTPEYNDWWDRRINDNILKPSHENSQSIKEYLRVIPSELEIIKQDFERRNAELEKKIGQIEEEKMNLRLDADAQKLEAERLRKQKVKAEEDLDNLKTDYKKLRLSMRTVRLGKTSEQWREEIREEKNKVDSWERKFQEVQTQNDDLKKSLLKNQKKKDELENRVTELEGSLHRHRNQNSVMELRASSANEDRQNEQLHYFQNQVRSRNHIMGEAVVQILEVADHLQTLAVQADMLSVKYESESSRG